MAAVGVPVTLLAIFLTAAVVYAPIRHVPGSGTLVLEQGQQAITEWVEVPAGSQARWEWNSYAFINFGVEARGTGLLAGDDTGAASGCARAVEAFAIRMWWGHTAWTDSPGAAVVNYTITVGAGDPLTCRTATDVHRASGVFGFSGSLDDPPLFMKVLPYAAGNLLYGALVAASLSPSREERRQKRLEAERHLQARERWVAEEVRLRELQHK